MKRLSTDGRLMGRREWLLGAALAYGGGRNSWGAAAPTNLGERPIFPPTNPWNRRVADLPVDPHSERLIRSIGLDKAIHPDFGAMYQGQPAGIPYIVVPGTQPLVPVRFEYADESDPGPYPIPDDAPIEGGADSKGDRHVLVVDRDHWKLYELYGAKRTRRGWSATSGAVFDLTKNTTRPAGWTSADAAGLPILPGLVRYDEVVGRGVIPHALRFTCQRTRHAYVAPARHFASRIVDASVPPMGMRVRLKATFDVARYPAPARVILTALQQFGMILADNGSDWFISGAPDARWNDDELGTIKRIKGQDLEVVRMGPVTTT